MKNFNPEIEKASEGKKFNFEEIAEIEPAMVSLVSKLKENIESGKYDTLISDDIGGRIPTLVLRKIIKEISTKKNLDTFFVAGGGYLQELSDEKKYAAFSKFLKNMALDAESVLLITQFTFRGNAIRRLKRELLSAGASEVDVAILRSLDREETLYNFSSKPGEHIFIGTREWQKITEGHEKLSGVRKLKKVYSPFPLKMVTVAITEGREISEEEWKEIFGIAPGMPPWEITKKAKDPELNAEYERREKIPLSPEEIKQIQQNINDARDDVNLLAEKVIHQVWPKK